MRSKQVLVGCDYFLSTPQRIRGDGSRRFVAADCLYDHISVVGEKSVEAVREKPRFEREVTLAIYIAHQHTGQIEADAEARRDRGSGLVEKADEAATNNTAPGESESYRSRSVNVGAGQALRVIRDFGRAFVSVRLPLRNGKLVERRAGVVL
jgi:hypothetical protein